MKNKLVVLIAVVATGIIACKKEEPAKATVSYEAYAKNGGTFDVSYTDTEGKEQSLTGQTGTFSRSITVDVKSKACYKINAKGENGVFLKLSVNGSALSDSMVSPGSCERGLQYCEK